MFNETMNNEINWIKQIHSKLHLIDIFLTFHFVYVGGYIFVPFTLDFFSLRNNVAALLNRKIL